MAKSPEEMYASMLANMPEKTGRSLEQWLALTATTSFEKHGQLVGFLKSEHGMTHGFANAVALRHFEASKDVKSPDDLEAAWFSGAKAGLRPIYDALIQAIKGLGDDVVLAPKKTYMSLRRSKQFALIQASTKTRVDLGLKLKREPEGRLEASGSFNAMCSHRVRISHQDEVDDLLIAWLKEAYNAA